MWQLPEVFRTKIDEIHINQQHHIPRWIMQVMQPLEYQGLVRLNAVEVHFTVVNDTGLCDMIEGVFIDLALRRHTTRYCEISQVRKIWTDYYPIYTYFCHTFRQMEPAKSETDSKKLTQLGKIWSPRITHTILATTVVSRSLAF